MNDHRQRWTTALIAACCVTLASAGQPPAERSVDDLIRMMPRAGEGWTSADGSGPPKICADLRAQIINKGLSDKQWNDLLTPARLFKYRRRWPAGVPFEVELAYPAWLGAAVEIRATPRLEQPVMLRSGRTWAGHCGFANSDLACREPKVDSPGQSGVVGTLPADARKVVFDIEIRSGINQTAAADDHPLVAGLLSQDLSGLYWKDSREIVKSTVTLWITQVPPEEFAQNFRADNTSDIDSDLQISLYPHGWADGKSRAYVALWWRRHKDDSDLAMGVAVDLLRDGAVVESRIIQGNDWSTSTDNALRPLNDVIFDSLLDRVDAIAQDEKEVARYALRVRGDAAAARSAWDAKRWWSGSITRPLKECLTADGTLRNAPAR
jgi:hypothetical protein